MQTRAVRAYLLLGLTAAIWGVAFVAQRVGAASMGPFAFNGTRFALGAASLIPLIALLDRRSPEVDGRAAWRTALIPGLIAGVVLTGASYFQQAGLSTTTAGKASFLTGMYIVLVPVLGMAVGHRTTTATWAGVLLAVVGLYFLSVTEAFTIAPGDVLELVGAVLWAVHILVIDRFGRVDPLRLSVVQITVCAAVNLLAAMAVEPAPFAGVGPALVPILYGGLLSVGIAYTLQVVAQRDAHPAHAALILSAEGIFGALGGALLIGESMSARMILGCALMSVGIVVSQIRSTTPQIDPIAA